MDLSFLYVASPLWFCLSLGIYSLRTEEQQMSLSHFMQCSLLMVMTFLGVYRFYFWVAQAQWQKEVTMEAHRTSWSCPETWIDWWLGFSAPWVFVYSFAFYFAFALVLVEVRNRDEMMGLLFRGCILVLIHCLFWMVFPTTIPSKLISLKEEHRSQIQSRTKPIDFSLMCLNMVQGLDGQNTNAVPSLHCSLASFLAMILYFEYSFSGWIWLALNILIPISCIKTKQHMFGDCCIGMVVAFVLYIVL